MAIFGASYGHQFIEKHKGKLTQQSIGPLQGNGIAAIWKIIKFIMTVQPRCDFLKVWHMAQSGVPKLWAAFGVQKLGIG